MMPKANHWGETTRGALFPMKTAQQEDNLRSQDERKLGLQSWQSYAHCPVTMLRLEKWNSLEKRESGRGPGSARLRPLRSLVSFWEAWDAPFGLSASQVTCHTWAVTCQVSVWHVMFQCDMSCFVPAGQLMFPCWVVISNIGALIIAPPRDSQTALRDLWCTFVWLHIYMSCAGKIAVSDLPKANDSGTIFFYCNAAQIDDCRGVSLFPLYLSHPGTHRGKCSNINTIPQILMMEICPCISQSKKGFFFRNSRLSIGLTPLSHYDSLNSSKKRPFKLHYKACHVFWTSH